jgi:adenylylsulfate kinase
MNSICISPCVIFLTGLSGSGKTTIANELARQFSNNKNKPVLLDGDEIRKKINLTAFDETSRKKHNLDTGRMAAALEAEGNIVIVALISPYKEVRQQIRKMCNRFIEVYLSTGIKICIERDPKGLYKKAINGEIKDFTGISAPYYPPSNPEIILDTTVLSVEVCVENIIALLSKE